MKGTFTPSASWKVCNRLRKFRTEQLTTRPVPRIFFRTRNQRARRGCIGTNRSFPDFRRVDLKQGIGQQLEKLFRRVDFFLTSWRLWRIDLGDRTLALANIPLALAPTKELADSLVNRVTRPTLCIALQPAFQSTGSNGVNRRGSELGGERIQSPRDVVLGRGIDFVAASETRDTRPQHR
jgi:hypothetical protein